MAVDSTEDRRAAAGVPYLPLGPGVTSNSGKDGEWRVQAAWGYSGIAIAGASAPSAEITSHVYRRRTHLKARKRTI